MPTRNHIQKKTGNRSARTRANSARLRRQALRIGDDIHQMGTIARQTAEERLDDLRDSAGEYYELGLDKVGTARRAMENYICNQPVKSVLIAAGLGLMIGRFVMRR